jgi:hypothetical protein
MEQEAGKNVARGEMSLVGPRPITIGEIEIYYGSSADEVLSIRPGFNWLAASYGPQPPQLCEKETPRPSAGPARFREPVFSDTSALPLGRLERPRRVLKASPGKCSARTKTRVSEIDAGSLFVLNFGIATMHTVAPINFPESSTCPVY